MRAMLSGVETRNGYPTGKIKEGGRLPALLGKHHNLYADLSAPSGYNAISRDLDYGYRFLEEFNEKLLFGTDRFTSIDEPAPPIIGFFKNALQDKKISQIAYDNIAHKNAQRLLK